MRLTLWYTGYPSPGRARPERKDRLHYSDAPITAENGVSEDPLSSLVLVRELSLSKGFADRQAI